MTEVRAMEWTGDCLRLLDQRVLPHQIVWRECRTAEEVAEAIKAMIVRGAPAIGAAAAFGMVLAAQEAVRRHEPLRPALIKAAQILAASRPTAVNLFWALERMKRVAEAVDEASLVTALEREALAIFREDYEANQRMGEWGASLLSGKVRVLTHCNTGSLATAGWGTALGVIRTAHRQGKIALVWVDETRPFLQGARLTMWELRQEGIPAKLIVDGAAAWVMRNGWVDAIFVGADRIARSGDVANKIGTYMLAVVAHHHGIPFYVVAPTSSIDLATPDGNAIPIEERHPDEVRSWGGVLVAPEGSEVFNPAFDVTPAELVTAIVTEQGIAYPPFEESLAAMVTEAASSRR